MRILIAIDEQWCAEAAFKFVSEHQQTENLHIRLVHVVSPIMIDRTMSSHPLFLESVAYEVCQDGKKLLEQAAGQLEGTGAEIEFDVLLGIPEKVIVEEAERWEADLIVLGTHSRRGLDKFFFGSVSYDVAAKAPCAIVSLPMPHVNIPNQTAKHASANLSNTGIIL